MIAKPVVKGKFWIIKSGEDKVGEVEKDQNGFTVTLGKTTSKIRTLSMIEERMGVQFEPPPARTVATGFNVSGFPTDTKPFNPVYDIQKRLPLYLRDEKSKCWFSAGWYQITQKNSTEWVFCPKLIILQRYRFTGPFKEKQA